MKFSVLLPTHNRLSLLKYAVESVLRQEYDDWELVISDNESEDDVEIYVKSLNDDRIKYFKTDRYLSVTENWNLALEKSSGDFVIMLGDDDALMPGYFTTISKLIETYNPEYIFTDGYLFAYPDVIPHHPDGYVQCEWVNFFQSND